MTRAASFSRRRFLRGCVAGAMSSPVIIPRHVLAAPDRPGANDRIGVAYIGGGRRARQLMNLPAEGRIVAVADVDKRRADEVAAMKSCRGHEDYRRILDATDVDAVIVATPDHWHVLPAIHACQAGKDIYLEKPLSLTIREGRLLAKAVAKYERVLQTGTQRRSLDGHRYGYELVRNGLAGRIHTVVILNYPSPWECRFPAQPVPSGLDWDRWCGATEPVPYHEDIFVQRSRPGWISLRPYSGGEMTGTGAHGFDQIQWVLGMDDTGPVDVWAEGGRLPEVVYDEPESRDRGNRLCSRGFRVRFRYANGVEIRLEDNGPAAGGEFIGDQGKIRIGNNVVTSNPPELARTPRDELKLRLPPAVSHLQNWFDCMKSRAQPIAHVEAGHRSATVCHLGNIVRWVGRPLRWDPKQEMFPEDDEANAYLDRPRRKPYDLPEV